MTDNFQNNVAYGNSTLSVSGNGVQVGDGAAGAKSIVFTNNAGALHLAGNATANATINLPANGGTVLLSSQAILSISAGAAAITSGQIIFSNSNGVSFGINGQTLTASYTVPTQTNQTLGFFATSNTTQNSSTTLDARSLTFQGAGIASVGYSNGSVIVSVPTGAPSPVNFSAGTTSGNLGSVVFSNSNGVSFGLNGSTITASAAGGGGTLTLFATGNTTQNSSTSLNVSSVLINGLGALSVGYSNGSVQVSAPQTSSIVGVGGISLSTNGSTISISNIAQSNWYNQPAISVAGIAQANSIVSVFPMQIPELVNATNFRFGASISVLSAANTSSAYLDLSASAVFYTRNVSTLSSIASGSVSYTAFAQNNSTGSMGGPKAMTISINGTSNWLPGEYWVALHISTTNSATGGANTTALARTLSMMIGNNATGAVEMNNFGVATNSSAGCNYGLGIISTNATRATIAISGISGNAGSGAAADLWCNLNNYTI